MCIRDSRRTLTHDGQAAARHQHPRRADAREQAQSVRRRQPPRVHVFLSQWPPPTRTRPPRPQTVAQRAVPVPAVSSHHNLNCKFSKHTGAMRNVAEINVPQPESLVYIGVKSRSGFKQNLHYEQHF